MSRLCCYWLCCYSESGRSEDSSASESSGNGNGGEGSSVSCIGTAATLSGLVSLAIVAVAVSTNQWLLTEERLTTRQQQQQQQHDNATNVKFTYSGLWRVCMATGSSAEYECSTIDYFPKEEYSPDPSDSTMAMPYAVTKSAVFFISATALLVAAEVSYFAGLLIRPRPSLCVFAAGIILIVSGLLMLVGMVMYISVFKAEVGSKLRPRSSFQGPPFVYRYGYSFLLYVSGFITTEFAGTTAVFLHITWQQRELTRERSKRKCIAHDSYVENYRVHGTPANHLYNGFHLCERHQKRYFYEHEPTAIDYHHNHHHHHHHHQLNYDDCLPPAHECNHYHHHGMTHDLTTETVSTIADVLQDEYPVGMQQDFVAFDLGENLPPLPENVRNSSWRSNSLRKTTPV
ncbi:uncharacterized protein LOC131667962 [Phymastichus coffea]|uniref:uncharacterized protein LOC131667962 n=1 Tax=Phymastichus coffea TaxID=108790 RepID=UPI00273B22F9|nr:uncharacterized protein LOC131667962 [Phymastichus coffea]XP_058797730.1 uncharacterized protein LOC131667962 [Phymastichus coffea]XP_058797731.1 uncharacterized protein LOC131667962 [Phymastichus coffea]